MPYGRNLLRPTASVWIFFMSILAVSIAIIEAMVWGLTSSIILPDELQYATLFIGILVGIFVWIFDASLITLDTSKPIFNPKNNSNKSFMAKFFSAVFSKKLGLGILARLAVLSISLYFTAPMLGQLFLEKEITRRMDAVNNSKISELVISTETQYNEKIDKLESQKEVLQADLRSEISGKSGARYGYGPVAKEIDRQILDTTENLERLKKEKNEALLKITSATPEEIAKARGLTLDQDNYETRNRIQQTIHEETGGKVKSEELAKIFLILVFSVMVILKIFQGKSVEVYYNDQLQELYEKYLTGYFNPLLEKKEWPDGETPMAPYRFHDWIYHTFVTSKDADLFMNEMLKAETQVLDTIENFNVNEQSQTKRIYNLQDQYDQILEKKYNLIAQQQQAELEASKIKTQTDRLSKKIQVAENDLAAKEDVVDDKDYDNIIQLKSQLLELNAKYEKLDAEKNLSTRKLETTEKLLEQTKDFLDEEHAILDNLVKTRHRLQLDQIKIIEQDVDIAIDKLRNNKQNKETDIQTEKLDKTSEAEHIVKKKVEAKSKQEKPVTEDKKTDEEKAENTEEKTKEVEKAP